MISSGESAIRSSRSGKSKEEIIDSANKAFGMSLFISGAGKLLDSWFGTNFICEITSREVFGGIMNLGNRE